MSKTKEYHVYIDGSAMVSTNRFGIGWIQTNEKGKYIQSRSERLRIHGADSTIAEIYAAQNALSHIKEDSKVVIYSDNAAVCEALARKSFFEPKKHRKNKLSEAWDNLAKAAAKHEDVSVIFTRENNNHYMHRAHLNAQEGAMKPFEAEDRENRAKEKHNKNALFSEIEYFYESAVQTPENI